MSSPNTLQLSSAETNNSPEHISRDELRAIIQEAYSTPVDNNAAGNNRLENLFGGDENEAEAATPRMTLEALELMAFEKSDDDSALNNNDINEAIDKLKTNAGTIEAARLDGVHGYLNELYGAIHHGTNRVEVRDRIGKDVDQEREVLAAATYKGINSLSSNKADRNAAQEKYDESLRLFGRFELHGKSEAEQKTEAAAIAIGEMSLLRGAIDKEYQQAAQAAEEKNWYEKARDGVDNFMKKGIDIKSKNGKKLRITYGHIATLGAGFGLGYALRGGINAVTGGMGATIVGTAAGAIAGGLTAGVRAQKGIKKSLRDTSDSDETILGQNVAGVEDIDVALRAHLSAEAQATRKERKKDIRRRVGKGMAAGAIAGAIGGGVADLLAYGPDAASINSEFDSLKEAASVDYPNWPDMTDIGDLFDGSDNGGSEASGDSAGNSEVTEGSADSSEVPFSDVPEIPAETATPTTEELLQHYAGDNADTAMAIEAGQGPYAAFEKLGIPESQWDDLMHNEELMERLVANENAYSLDAAGIQDYGFGLSGSELSPDSIQAIYEAAGMDNIDAAVDTAPVDTNLPESYQDLPPEVQEFAQQKYDVVMNIESGMGGEKLMEALNADPQAWYNFEYDLLQAAPNDFYLMNDGHVGISHTGALSPEAIEALAKGLSQNSYALAA